MDIRIIELLREEIQETRKQTLAVREEAREIRKLADAALQEARNSWELVVMTRKEHRKPFWKRWF